MPSEGPVIENFHVRIVYGGGLPVTYIEYDVPGGKAECFEYSPSSAIIFVRNYLEEKLSGHEEIEFQFLGPSPFHADFFTTRCNDHTADFTESDISLSGLGYKTFYFEFPVSDEELLDAFVTSHQPILSAYYSVIRYRNRSMRLGSKIADGTQSLILGSRLGGFTSLNRWFRQGPIIDKVYKSILDQKLNNIELTNFFSGLNANEEIDETSVVLRFIERAAKDPFAVPTDDVKDILKMLEDRRQGYIRNTTTIVSGLIGGVLGATLTFLLSSHLATSKSSSTIPRLHNPITQQAAPEKPQNNQ
jgi:hypothetical protein